MSASDPPNSDSDGGSPAGESPYTIVATTSLMERRPRILKADDTFAVFDHTGNIAAIEHGAEGLFHRDTRFISRYVLRIADGPPLLLGSNVATEGALLFVEGTNPDIYQQGEVRVHREVLHISRQMLLAPGSCHERLHLHNYGRHPVTLPLSIDFGSDFADIFEVRGLRRQQHGKRLAPEVQSDAVVLSYVGLDQISRSVRLRFSPAPARLREHVAEYRITLEPDTDLTLEIKIDCRSDDPDEASALPTPRFRAAAPVAVCRIVTASEACNEWLERAYADLRMLVTATPDGPYPYAGTPWFSTAFGRDGIITALEYLWIDPSLAAGVLRFLAAHQATEIIPDSDAEPGKILHEMRHGEMALLGEVPFRKYYGSVDATPLFVMLAEAYLDRTGDLGLLRSIWPNIVAALDWLDRYGDRDGDGFIEYDRRSEKGLVNQGWKDSEDSVFMADGRLAEPPIALVEVQAYAFAARRGGSRLARVLGFPDLAERLALQAAELRNRFEAGFWCPEIGTYALALDGAKQPCRVRTSNPGHVLFAGVPSADRAAEVAATLMAPDSFSGWGIRTVSTAENAYNPMSYHNGSIWPHDNALIALGLARYGQQAAALRVLEGLFAASQFMDLKRLPELFCGFPRQPGQGPTSYPVACMPQAWASAAVFALIGGCLNIHFDPAALEIRFDRPTLPDFLPEVRLRDLCLGDATIDLLFRRHEDGVTMSVLRRTGPITVVLTS